MIILRNSYYSSPYYGGGYSDLEERLYTKAERKLIADQAEKLSRKYWNDVIGNYPVSRDTWKFVDDSSRKWRSNAVSKHLKERRENAIEARKIISEIKNDLANGKISKEDYRIEMDDLLEQIKKSKKNEMDAWRKGNIYEPWGAPDGFTTF